MVDVEEIVKFQGSEKKMQKKCGGISENRWKKILMRLSPKVLSLKKAKFKLKNGR